MVSPTVPGVVTCITFWASIEKEEMALYRPPTTGSSQNAPLLLVGSACFTTQFDAGCPCVRTLRQKPADGRADAVEVGSETELVDVEFALTVVVAELFAGGTKVLDTIVVDGGKDIESFLGGLMVGTGVTTGGTELVLGSSCLIISWIAAMTSDDDISCTI